MSETVMYVIFEKDTGKVLGISPKDEHENTIPVNFSEVLGILNGTDRKRNYRVEYNPKTKQLELCDRHEESFDGSSVNDFIYEIPEEPTEDADIVVEQDKPNTCWRIKLGKQLKKNLRKKGIKLNTRLSFSITAKHDPNILYKTLSVDFTRILNDNYAVVDFSMPFETENIPISVFTARRFDSYEFRRILDE
jgi:hypothetical protein